MEVDFHSHLSFVAGHYGALRIMPSIFEIIEGLLLLAIGFATGGPLLLFLLFVVAGLDESKDESSSEEVDNEKQFQQDQSTQDCLPLPPEDLWKN